MVEYYFQIAIFDVLSKGLSVPVFDDVPDNQSAPYVVIGDTTFTSDNTDLTDGFDIVATIHTWSTFRGREQIKQLQGEIYALLNRSSFAMDGYNVLGITREFSETFTDPDNIHRHGVERYRVKVVVLDGLS